MSDDDVKLTAESVRDSGKGRPVVYWRYWVKWSQDLELAELTGRPVGAVSRRDADGHVVYSDADTVTWRTMGYPANSPRYSTRPGTNVLLGEYRTRAAAERALRDYVVRCLQWAQSEQRDAVNQQPATDRFRATLVQRRKDLGLTTQALADRMGVARSRISMYEGAKQIGTLDFVSQYAAALGGELALTLPELSAKHGN